MFFVPFPSFFHYLVCIHYSFLLDLVLPFPFVFCPSSSVGTSDWFQSCLLVATEKSRWKKNLANNQQEIVYLTEKKEQSEELQQWVKVDIIVAKFYKA